MIDFEQIVKALNQIKDFAKYELEMNKEYDYNYGPFDIAVWNDSTPRLGTFMVIQIDHAESGKTCFHYGDIQRSYELESIKKKLVARVEDAIKRIKQYAKFKQDYNHLAEDYLEEEYYDSLLCWLLKMPMEYPDDKKQFESMSEEELKDTVSTIDKVVTEINTAYYGMEELAKGKNYFAYDIQLDWFENDYPTDEEWVDYLDTMRLHAVERTNLM